MNQTSQDENYNNNQQDDIVSMYQQILSTLIWREMKDSEGELKMVKMWSLFKYKLICNAINNLNSSLRLGQWVFELLILNS